MPAELRRKRQRSIRVLLTLIFIVPLASLLGLWAFAASVTGSSALKEHTSNGYDQTFGGPAQSLLTQVAQERLLSYEWLSSGGRLPSEAVLLAQQRATNVAANAMRNAGSSVVAASSLPALREFNTRFDQLTGSHGIRAAVDARRIPALTAFSDYNTIVDAAFALYDDLVEVSNTTFYIQGSATVEAGRSVELASREATLITGALVSGDQMSRAVRTVFAQTVANRQLLMADALSKLNSACGSGYRHTQASAAYRGFTAVENQIIASIGKKGPVPINVAAFEAASVPLFKDYQAAEKQDRKALSSLGTQIGDKLLLEVGLAGGAGLVAVALSVFLMLWFGRRVTRDLTGLQHAALELAEDRLPRVVSRLSQGEDVDVAGEAAPITSGRIAETAGVAEAFSSVQRTAFEAAVGQARLRRGVSQVFRNLAWRSQSLLHRQLALLDMMERRETEPETLDELFQLDHLTTRMRRHAEGLIILSGSTPGRGWRDPVPAIDVLRGAVAEVEDYKRVTVLCDSDDAIVGTAVADVIHLLAELIENATTFSPASTAVTVRAERVANGFAAEIEDRGIGIGAEDLEAFNERLANPPEFDLADSNQLGLFVVARLASKHHILVTLRRSPFGGIAAIVLMPNSIVVTRDEAKAGAFDVFRIERPARDGADRDGGLALRAEWSSPRVDSLAAASHRGPEQRQEPAGTSPGTGAAEFALVDSAPQAGETNAAAAGGITGGNGSNGAATSAWDHNASNSAWEVSPPPLPRRRRQASLAPELRTDGEADHGGSDSQDNLSPASTRALVESLRYGLDRATAISVPADESWPAEDTAESAMTDPAEDE